jgi:hypothetical protein
VIEHKELAGNGNVCIDNVLDRSSNILGLHIPWVIILVDGKDPMMLRMLLVQELEISRIAGRKYQLMLARVLEVPPIRRTDEICIAWTDHDVAMLLQDGA